MGGLICWKKGDPPSAPAPVTTQAAVQTSEPINMNPPPPPPPPIEDDAGVDAGATASTVKGTGPAGPGPCAKCGDGQISPALSSAMSAAQGSVSGCYQRALRTSEVSGSMTVRVQVGAGDLPACPSSSSGGAPHRPPTIPPEPAGADGPLRARVAKTLF